MYCNIWNTRICALLAVCAGGAMARGQSSDLPYVTTHLAPMTAHLEAYGQVEPVTVLPISAAETGIVAGLNVLPGMQVHAGQELGRLIGPQIESLLTQGQADVRSASAQLASSQKSLAIVRQQLSTHLSTRQAVHQAEAAQAQTQANYQNAESRLKAVRQMTTLTAPESATVLALNATNGEIVNAGQPMVTLQLANRLWLKAAYYGSDLSTIRMGMKGVFSPADGGAPIPVRVSAVFGAIAAGGGESVALVPIAPGTPWINGEFGKVVLNLAPRKLVTVPTRALILDGGKWWVMVHTAQGDRAQAVVPGPAEGWNTFIESGLVPGAEIVVKNAYLLYHASISEQFQIPD